MKKTSVGNAPLIKRYITFYWTAMEDNDQKYFQLAVDTFRKNSGAIYDDWKVDRTSLSETLDLATDRETSRDRKFAKGVKEMFHVHEGR